MTKIRKVYFANKSTEYFVKLCHLVYLAGFPNFLAEELNYSKTFIKYYDYFAKSINASLYVFMFSEWAASFTQHNLTNKQSSDSILFDYSHPILFSYRLIMTYHKEKIRDLIFSLSVKLKKDFNDEQVEKDMIRKSKICTIAFSTICSVSLVMYGFDGLLKTLKTDGTFTTVITAWPDVEDKSPAADFVRGVSYVTWWVFMTRVYGSYGIMLSLTVALEHQYKNLRVYFRSLLGIFEEDLSQAEKERKYEEGVKVGVKLHSDTLKCVQLAQETCSTIYCLQILLNTTVLVSLMAQMLHLERTVGSVSTIVFTTTAMLLSTGFFMWTAGDLTVEAAELATDMYSSGWQNCYGHAVSVRQLLTVAMAQAQKPVIIKGLGVVKISYRAYLSIVRSSYSIFTVLY